jgi:vancomycin resistance protein YoaR
VKGKDLQLAYELDSGVLEGKVATVAAELYRPEIEPELVWLADEEEDEGGKVAVIEGVKGRRVDRGKLKGEILSRVGQLEKLRLEVPIKEEGVSLSEKEKAAAVVRAETWGNKQLVVKANVDGDKEGKVVGGGGGDGLSWTWEKGDIWRLWDWQEGWDEKKVMARLEELAAQVDRPAENALFQFDSRFGRVSEFQPGVRGWEIDREKSVGLIVEAGKGLEEGEEEEVEVELVGVETEPEVETGGANDLGIEELLGQGRSRFAHSIASRIHNIAVASGKLNGILVKPGETF